MFDARLNLFRQILRAERIAGAKENEKIKLLKFNVRINPPPDDTTLESRSHTRLMKESVRAVELNELLDYANR